MTVIIKANIVTDVSDNLLLGLNSNSDALDRFIKKTLSDMSKRGLLVGTDATQTLSDGSETLNYPTGFRSVISITLTDSSGNKLEPLIKLSGGQKEYRELIAFGSNTSSPQWFSEFNEKIYLLGKAGEAYTTLIEYRKNHAKDANAIEFSTDFENLMFAGTTFWKAAQLGRAAALSLWSPLYRNEMREAALSRKQQPSLLRG